MSVCREPQIRNTWPYAFISLIARSRLHIFSGHSQCFATGNRRDGSAPHGSNSKPFVGHVAL
ncbi:hypothetical protein FA15DRAFT_671363 [Coprinopsis marcescibilis]|uniref:Uncharacterized protein n=1 Tax=Coprinopsis marcescibilis TaxID=230819 RepID=A0A5C3L324_COPMA|nr:hypothetical protein FA15DRAFT_671363 [Coprinopsis marcescibilis]